MIKRSAATTVIITAVIVLCCGFQAVGDWVQFSTDDHSCKVLLPVEPKKQTKTKDTESGAIVSNIWISKPDFGLYLLGITDYPIDVDTQRELELDRDNFLKAVNARLIDDSDITLSGHPGKEFTGASDTYTYKSRVYLVGRRVYQIVAAEPSAAIDSTRVKKFLESFELVKVIKS